MLQPLSYIASKEDIVAGMMSEEDQDFATQEATIQDSEHVIEFVGVRWHGQIRTCLWVER